MSFENPSTVEKKSLEQLKTEAQNDIAMQLSYAGIISTPQDARAFENRLEYASNVDEFVAYLEDTFGEKAPSVVRYAKLSKKLDDYFENKK